jgi:hypothetical protein
VPVKVSMEHVELTCEHTKHEPVSARGINGGFQSDLRVDDSIEVDVGLQDVPYITAASNFAFLLQVPVVLNTALDSSRQKGQGTP